MSPIIILIIFLGFSIALLAYFIIKSVISPKKAANMIKLYKDAKYNATIKASKQLLVNDPNNVDAHYCIGLSYSKEGKSELALMELKTINQIGSFTNFCTEKDFRLQIAALYLRYNQPEEALKEYILLIKKDPSNADYYFHAGELFASRNKADKASSYYRKTIQLDSRHSEAHFKLGQLLYKNKKLVEAKAELGIALKINPENYQASFILGKILKENHDYVAALLAFEKAQRDPENKVKALVERGGCYMSMNNYEKAQTELERALKLTENQSSAETLYGRYFLAMCYEKTRMLDKAIDQWEQIYQKKPSFQDVAEKLSNYQELRTDDRIKDYLVASPKEFNTICQAITGAMDLKTQDISEISNGCQIIAVEDQSKWRAAKKMPRVIWYLRNPESIAETKIRALQDYMKKQNTSRGIIVSSSNFSRKAIEFAENRPIELINKEKLQELLKKIDLP